MAPGKLLIIGKTWPEPLATAAGSRMMQLIACFREAGYAITFASTATPTVLSADLRGHVQLVQQIAINDSSFDSWLFKLQPDMVLFDRFISEEQFGWRVAAAVPGALRLLDTEDLHSLRLSRQEAIRDQHTFEVKRWLEHDCTLRELASILRCDVSLIISTYEMQLLCDTAKIDPRLLLHLPFMFDPVVSQELKPIEGRHHFICLGNGRHLPNTDAMQWLKREIWPMIHRELPNVRVDVCGAYLPATIRKLHDPAQGFHVMGWVEHTRTALERARVQLAPLRFGAGIKGKLADAMRWGTPSVTTSIGAEGMHSGQPWAGCIANAPEEFADEAIRLYRDARAWKEAQRQGQEIINGLFSKSALSSALLTRITSLMGNLGDHRARNVVGAMLQRSGMASTRYMGKWIEVKNALKALS